MKDFSNHPCFNAKSRASHARIHLPVAPKCNVQCNFCDRKYCCVNESRPGVSAAVLSPAGALRYLDDAMDRLNNLSVVGIAGPGDPFANPEETLATLRLVKEQYPELLLCVSSNGLALERHVDALADLGVSHVTVTVNAIEAEIVEKIYSWIYAGGKRFYGREAAEFLIYRQGRAVDALIRVGLIVKINTVVIPGVNDGHIAKIAESMAARGVDIHNCIPLIPTANTAFGHLAEPGPDMIHRVRAQAGEFLPQMSHCSRCRADACGLLGEKGGGEEHFERMKVLAKG
jgi:nitrogen fixation protein NifB